MKTLVVKLLGLFSSLGGPLLLFDHVRVTLDDATAFALAWTPVALIMLGALTLGDDPRGRLARISVGAGLVGAGLLSVQNAFASWQLLVGSASQSSPELVVFGIVVGIGAVAAYVRRARDFLWPRALGGLVR